MVTLTRRELARGARLGAIVAAILALSACGESSGSSGLDEIRLLQAAPASIAFNATYVGEELGYFEEEGIELSVLDPGDLTEIAFLDNGQADIAFTGSPEVIEGIEAGVDLKIVYEYWQTAIEGVAALGSGDIDSVSDLEGGVVGLASDSDKAILDVALRIAGVSEEAVETVVIGDSGGVIAQNLADGTVDAFVGSLRDFRNLEAAGADIKIITPPEMAENPGETFILLDSSLSKDRDLYERFFRAWTKSTYAALANEEALVRMAEKAIPEAVQDESILQAALGQMREGNKPLTKQFGEIRPDAWQRVIDQLVASGDLEEDLEIDQYLDDSLIAAANDFDPDEVQSDVDAWLADNQ